MADDDLFGSDLTESSGNEENLSHDDESEKEYQDRATNNLHYDRDSENGSNGNGDEAIEDREVVRDEVPFYNFEPDPETYLAKLPNFISVEPSPFHSEAYVQEPFQDEFMDDEGRVRLKLKVENTIRWRQTKGSASGATTSRESNARLVRWSDGSMSLHVGAEMFDVIKAPLVKIQNQLFIKQGSGLCCKGMVPSKLNFKPHSTLSDTHKRVTVSVADRLARAQRTQTLPSVGMDPEKERRDKIKAFISEEEKLKKESKISAKMRRSRELNASKIGLDAICDAEVEELEKRLGEYENRSDVDDIFSDDDDLNDDDTLNSSAAATTTKANNPTDSDDLDYQENSSSDSANNTSQTKKKRPKMCVADDEDDS